MSLPPPFGKPVAGGTASDLRCESSLEAGCRLPTHDSTEEFRTRAADPGVV